MTRAGEVPGKSSRARRARRLLPGDPALACRLARPLALLAAGLLPPALGAGEPSSPATTPHLVPAEKGLSPDWIRGLLEGREPLVWTGGEAATIGMPVGGVAAGQLYLLGDGTLGSWGIFNTYVFTGWGQDCYVTETPDSPVESGIAVVVETDDGTSLRTLNRAGFSSVEFAGEYPRGLVRYTDTGAPVRVELEAFSPFIPLAARDSSLPATLLHVTVENISEAPVRASVLGWLENAVCRAEAIGLGAIGWRETTTCRDPGSPFRAKRRTRTLTAGSRTHLVHDIEGAGGRPPRPPILFEDFEAERLVGWTVEGETFRPGPTEGPVVWQRRLEGYVGRRLANSFHVVHDEDGRLLRERCLRGRATGSLTSREFEIERDYITFYIGKGDIAGETCIDLLIDGEVVRTATGSPNAKHNILKDYLLWSFWDVSDLSGRRARIRILDAAETAPPNHRAEICVDHIVLCDVDGLRGAGTMALSTPDPTVAAAPLLRRTDALPGSLHAAVDVTYPAGERRCGSLASKAVTLAPGSRHTVTFVLSWCFPNHRFGRDYANRFGSAREVADHVLDHHDRLAGRTRQWHQTFYEDSTLPRWLLFRLHAPVANLATGTWLWWKDGRPWGWEGVGSCKGTCTHVYNYAQAHAFLFPEMARLVREMQDLDAGYQETTGLVGFRSDASYAADGQCGTVLKAYREHRMSADRRFLERNWPRLRKVLEHAIEQDGDGDGLIENRQPNTYDVSFYGANTFVGSLYLAALHAGEAMAEEMRDAAFAARCRALHESGRRRTMERLWNGEFFTQEVDLDRHERAQYGPGCLSDQLFGQSWAHLLGLGHIYPDAAVARAYESIWTYNWAPRVEPYCRAHRPSRRFAAGDDAGLILCTWPRSPYLDQGVRYKNEVWTGIEYQVAAGMIWEGMVEQGLAICRGIHDRYRPGRHNPFNEVECGDHYARALASWSVYHALLGYEHHGPRQHIAFAPRICREDFAAAFTAAEGWGLFRQERTATRQVSRMAIRYGRLRLRSLGLEAPEGLEIRSIAAAVDGRPVPVRSRREASRLRLEFPPLTLREGEELSVTIAHEPRAAPPTPQPRSHSP